MHEAKIRAQNENRMQSIDGQQALAFVMSKRGERALQRKNKIQQTKKSFR